MTLDQLDQIYPFITICKYGGVEYLGIMQNRDGAVTTIYDYGAITDPVLRKLYLKLANIWWWESNRSIPINIFLRNEWAPFKNIMKTFPNKELDIIHGPIVSISQIVTKKTKKKLINIA